MQSIKFYKKYDTHYARFGEGVDNTNGDTKFFFGTEYKGYNIGDLPPSFGFITNSAGQEGKSHWFNYKGLTYIEVTESPWQ